MEEDINKKLDDISKKLDKLTKTIEDNQEKNTSFESRIKQWIMFYVASYLADKTLMNR